MFELLDDYNDSAVIKIIGVGGGGGNVIELMLTQNIEGVEFITVTTDSQRLRNSSTNKTLQIGSALTKGLGAGAKPTIGRDAALESINDIKELVKGADIVFVLAGLGGGTGTGASSVIAKTAKELGILTVGVVSKPFPFEGNKRQNYAAMAVEELLASTDSLTVLDNQSLIDELDKGASLLDGFKAANQKMSNVVATITDLITRPGLINVDYADVRTVIQNTGMAKHSDGIGRGDERAESAIKMAINSAKEQDFGIVGSQGLLVNITAGMDVSIDEFEIVANGIKSFAAENSTVVVGCVIDSELIDDFKVSVFYAGIDKNIIKNTSHLSDKNYLSDNNQIVDDSYLDIPAFLRKQVDDPLKNIESSNIKIVASETTSDRDIAELIGHLSNVYKSVGGDELIVKCVNDLPPNSNSNRGVLNTVLRAFR